MRRPTYLIEARHIGDEATALRRDICVGIEATASVAEDWHDSESHTDVGVYELKPTRNVTAAVLGDDVDSDSEVLIE